MEFRILIDLKKSKIKLKTEHKRRTGFEKHRKTDGSSKDRKTIYMDSDYVW